MDLPVICACSLDTAPIKLFTKVDDRLYPSVEVEDRTITCHNLEAQALPIDGRFRLEDGVVTYGIEEHRVPVGRYFDDLTDLLSTWCEQANTLIYSPEPSAA